LHPFSPWAYHTIAEFSFMVGGMGMDGIRTSLKDLQMGQRGYVTGLLCSGTERRRLLDLGLCPGSRVTALHKSPFHGPVAYGVLGAVIALRGADAAHVQVALQGDGDR